MSNAEKYSWYSHWGKCLFYSARGADYADCWAYKKSDVITLMLRRDNCQISGVELHLPHDELMKYYDPKNKHILYYEPHRDWCDNPTWLEIDENFKVEFGEEGLVGGVCLKYNPNRS